MNCIKEDDSVAKNSGKFVSIMNAGWGVDAHSAHVTTNRTVLETAHVSE